MNLYDKNMSEDKKASLEFAEASREQEWKYPSFALQLFHGKTNWRLIHPFPAQSIYDKELGDMYLAQLSDFLQDNLHPDEVDRTGVIPDDVIRGLARHKAFAMKIPKEYGGLGLSQMNYNRAIHLVASYCGSTAVLLSAHQSIGVPQPLKLFGTKEQKEKYLPMFANGAISAFALTETEAGSDPRMMTTTATPTEDGKHFLLNGEKLWCTNGPIAKVIVVMAVTPPKIVNGKEIKQITAFIVETDSPGFETVHRCEFMGLHGIQNGVIRFKDLKVPRENIILGEGEGLKLALTTLNTGRLTLPAASVGISKWCISVCRQWGEKRKQWGAPIAEHESIAVKIGYMATHTFAMEAMAWLTAGLSDREADIRLEAAIAKYFSTQHSWKIVDETLQIRGGQGYETAASLKKRGMQPWAVERVLRDVRINLIIEGTSEIMHLFIAREALDPHLTRVKPFLSAKTFGAKMKAFGKIFEHYVSWYPSLVFYKTRPPKEFSMTMQEWAVYVERSSRRLAKVMFKKMNKYKRKLESRQLILNRIVDIGVELFAMASVCAYTEHLTRYDLERINATDLADGFCRAAKIRVERLFEELKHDRMDDKSLQIARDILAFDFEWLETDIII